MLETLRPPEGYRFDRAVGTTFTLDLESLLTAPLAFTFFDWEDADGRPSADPLALLEAIRRHATRIHLFCQVGQIKIPSANQRLLAYIEDAVIEARAPHSSGLFHPKVWIIRFTPIDSEEPVMYRLLCMSRNLAQSRSWDTTLVLDGVLKNRTSAIRRNHPVGDFIQALPGMAVRRPSQDVRQAIDTIQYEIRRVDFALPEGFRDAQFHPMGHIIRNSWPFPDEPREFLVLSPFLSGTFVHRLAKIHTIQHLISRPESLTGLPAHTLDSVTHTWAMAPDAELDSNEGVDEDLSAVTGELSAQEGDELAGLHAKLFVMDDGWNAHVWTGSANATEAAFQRNVEFMVQLTGRKKHCGIAALLGSEEHEEGLRLLLEEYTPGDTDPPEDPERLALQHRIRQALQTLLDAHLTVRAESADDEHFSLTIATERRLTFQPDVEVDLWPATLSPGMAQKLDSPSTSLEFSHLSMSAITAFIAFHVRARATNKVEEERFILRLPMSGAPSDRRERILQSLLTDPDQIMRLLLLLLSDEGLRADDFIPSGQGSGNQTSFGGLGSSTLLESLVRAFHRDPDALDYVENLISELQKTAKGQALLPPGLEQIWAPIRSARKEMRR